MSKLILIVALILATVNILLCQNYQVVYSKRTLFLEDDYGRIKAVKIDSVEAAEDSIFYPMRTIRHINFDCYSPYAPTWFGEKVIIKPDGYSLFFNQNNDTVIIKTDAVLGEKWLAYQLPDSLIIFAEIAANDAIDVLGITDSVKTISFKAYDKMMNPVTHQVNAKTLRVAENFGIIETFDFFRFPDFDENDYYYQGTNFKLAGMTNPDLGIQNLTWKQVYDFNIGDEIHELYEYWQVWGVESTESITQKTIRKYLNKTDRGDTVYYEVELIRSRTRRFNDNTTSSYLHDTLTSMVCCDTVFDRLPGASVFEEGFALIYYMGKCDISRRTKSKQSLYDYIVGNSGDSCWSWHNCDGCFPEYIYIEGLGGPYYWCENWWMLGEEENQLVYYKKGVQESGTPLIISEVKEKSDELEFKIFPNPAKEIFYITTSSEYLPYTFEIYDITGKKLFTADIYDSEFRLNTAQYKGGIYIYKLVHKDKILKTGKLIVEF
ncbi:MAG: T9SS type A sorting domain-containing protein [Bacteroidales bacterium]|nr:T9SS type A sorting domain-containing protein [Bacteroidales bacterium]